MIGIYKITNLINHKVYIGQSWNIEKRWRQHKKTDSTFHLYRSIKKYGLKNFNFDIVRKISKSGITQVLLNSLETKYIKEYKSYDPNFGYNKTFGGHSMLATDETREKMSKAKKGIALSEEHKLKIGKSQKGKICKPFSKEHKDNLSKAHIGKKLSEEHSKNIGRGNLGKKHPSMSIDARNKISKSHKGNIPWNKGKVTSQEIKEKISKSKKGTCLSQEHKQKLSKSQKLYWINKKNRR